MNPQRIQFSKKNEKSKRNVLAATGQIWCHSTQIAPPHASVLPLLLCKKNIAFTARGSVVMLRGLKYLNKATRITITTHIQYKWKRTLGQQMFLKLQMECNFLSEGTVWHQLAGSSSDRVGSAESRPLGGRRFGRVKVQSAAAHFCCCCCCLRLSSRICLWAGSRTPASSRSSSVMSLETEKMTRVENLKLLLLLVLTHRNTGLSTQFSIRSIVWLT